MLCPLPGRIPASLRELAEELKEWLGLGTECTQLVLATQSPESGSCSVSLSGKPR